MKEIWTDPFFFFMTILVGLSLIGVDYEMIHEQGAVVWGSPAVHIEPVRTVNGTEATLVSVKADFRWNDNYALPDNVSTYLIINNVTRIRCKTLARDQGRFLAECFEIYNGDVKSLRLIVATDNVIVAEKEFRRGDGR